MIFDANTTHSQHMAVLGWCPSIQTANTLLLGASHIHKGIPAGGRDEQLCETGSWCEDQAGNDLCSAYTNCQSHTAACPARLADPAGRPLVHPPHTTVPCHHDSSSYKTGSHKTVSLFQAQIPFSKRRLTPLKWELFLFLFKSLLVTLPLPSAHSCSTQDHPLSAQCFLPSSHPLATPCPPLQQPCTPPAP